MAEACKEYNSMKYRNMILKGTNIECTTQTMSADKLDDFLNKDIEQNRKNIWTKLSKTEKCKRIKEYIDNKLTTQYQLDSNDKLTALKFFNLLLERKKLSKSNELSYNKEEHFIEQVTGLIFNPITRKFSINNEVKTNKTIKKVKPLKEKEMKTNSNVNVNESSNDVINESLSD
jgi:hypothetical protein